MIRNAVALIAVAVIGSAVWADDKPVDRDLKALQGTWVVESAQQDGKKVADDVRKNEEYCLYAVKVKDDKFQIAFLKNKTEFGDPIAFTLDVAAKPKVLEWQDNNRRSAVAYAIDGDKLTICFYAAERAFDFDKLPKKLETAAGDQCYLFVLRRSKEK